MALGFQLLGGRERIVAYTVPFCWLYVEQKDWEKHGRVHAKEAYV